MYSSLLKSVVVVSVVVFLSSAGPTYAQGREASFQSYNFPTRFIRHRNSLGFIEDVRREGRLRKDAHFKVVPGLAGRCSSFESMNYPGHYLRHQSFRLKLARFVDEQLFRDDATFCMRPGLAYGQGDWFSFESVNLPNHFIRHRNFELWLDRRDGSDLFRKDATFQVTSPIGGPID